MDGSTDYETPLKHDFDLPDSFAPLLSSSQTEMLLHHLTADLIHGVYAEASLQVQQGKHEIPLDKDPTRPQFCVEVPRDGCRISVMASIGSDGFDREKDLDVTIPTTSRSHPLVKGAGLTFDPPLPLLNVAPTLIHIPTLWEDNYLVPKLRRMPIMRFVVDTVIAISNYIEKVLWIIESFLQIHLHKVRVTPLYKGRSSVDDNSPEWRLSLAFSGHCLLFGVLPIPFINVILPTFVIPQPHALLEYLLSKQPLASARLKRENIAEQKLAIAFLDMTESWNAKLEVVATPPAVGIDLTLPGGVSLGMEFMHGRDSGAGKSREGDFFVGGGGSSVPFSPAFAETLPTPRSHISGTPGRPPNSATSVDTWTTHENFSGSDPQKRMGYRNATAATNQMFDANNLVPWKIEMSAKGNVSKEKVSFHLLDLSLLHEDPTTQIPSKSQLKTRGSLAVWKEHISNTSKSHYGRRSAAFAHRAALAGSEDSPSAAALLLFPEKVESLHGQSRLLQYDYAFDVSEDSKVDAITFSIGATHPMLNGGSMVTTILESIYAFGSVTARENAALDPLERRRKRNVLRHLPAIDFSFGVQNGFIPPESSSYTDDGQTRSLPEMDGARLRVRFLGGIEKANENKQEDDSVGMSIDFVPHEDSGTVAETPVKEGIKVIGDFGVSNLVLNSETYVKEFPELDIFEGTKLRAFTSAKLGGNVQCHLRPQRQHAAIRSSAGPNIFNPLEAYEIDFSGSNLSGRIRESTTSLGHRRIIVPAETTVKVQVVESVVDMTMEGKSQLELLWDFQGLSPILQVTEVGLEPETVNHEKKEQVSLLVAPLRQGRLSVSISEVGGVSIEKAATSREDKEGLYDWKFFNALFSHDPDQESTERLLDVLDDKRTMNKLLQVVKLVNADVYKFLNFVLVRVWRLKDIMDQEGVSDPKHIIPGHRMARLLSLMLCGDLSEVPACLQIIRRVVAGDGLDAVKVKELLRKHVEFFDEWAPEIDRAIRMAETMFNPTPVAQNYVEDHLTPLAEIGQYLSRFQTIPSAAHLYEQLMDRPDVPLDRRFSNLVGRISPYLSFRQIGYFLSVRSSKDWQPSDLKRLRYVYAIKRKVMDIAESYGGLSFLPQSFLVSVFLGEATRSSLKAIKFTGKKQVRRIQISNNPSTLVALRQRRARLQGTTLDQVAEETSEENYFTPAAKVASMTNFLSTHQEDTPSEYHSAAKNLFGSENDEYELGDCLLGPGDVAILLQAGLTSVMKGSSVVQLNQRMLLDLVTSQPKSFAVAVLAEIGTPGGQGSPRQLASALMALLDILEDAECYMALKFHLHRYRHASESDPIPQPRDEPRTDTDEDGDRLQSKHQDAVKAAREKIESADKKGEKLLPKLLANEKAAKRDRLYKETVNAYNESFRAVARVRELDKLAFQSEWFRAFYQRNYNALMVKSVYDNVIDDVDNVRGARYGAPPRDDDKLLPDKQNQNLLDQIIGGISRGKEDIENAAKDGGKTFLEPERSSEQKLLDAILDALIYDAEDRERLRKDPLMRLLIPNPDGHYEFTIVTAMGVITEGKAGTELEAALERLENKRGVKHIRADTATARSFEYNAERILEAIAATRAYKVPFGLLGYSQGCPNTLLAESLLYSGTPDQQEYVKTHLACRQLLFSAANGSLHGAATDKKVSRLIVMIEEFVKYQQGYFSRALQSAFLETITTALDSAQFHKLMGGANGFLFDGCRAFWREAQHLPNVPTCTLRGVLEPHTTPEALEMVTNMMTKQSGSALHDSQVHVFDAVGHPVYHHNRNGRILEKCEVGSGAIQRTHHWSPLNKEVDFVTTPRDHELASFDCAKDRHIFPWVDVNARFGFISYKRTGDTAEGGHDG
ncbi:MAG: hypothetical protein SGILL_002686 [Bacillariaceae sp.]